MKILAADYVLPISSEPIIDGALVIDADKIITVGELSDIKKQFPHAAIDNYGEAAILPGFVNCHSHLEITSMRGSLDDIEHDFRSWLLKLNAVRSQMSDADIEAAAVAGAHEGSIAGVTCFGDIGRYGRAGLEALKKIGLRGVLFQETEFSPDDRTADDDFKKLCDKFLNLRGHSTDLVEVGLSPHSPYTVSAELFSKISEFALRENIKLTIHAAESAEEDRLLKYGSGFFTGLYEKFGVEWKSPAYSSIKFLESTGVLETAPLLAHCVTVSDEDIEIIQRTGASIAHCPKSNAKLGHGSAPLEKFLDAGVAVGLGSDSVASNNICDMLEEARFAVLTARNRSDRTRFIPAKEILETVTLGGARSLGLDHKIGTLEPGKQADIAVVSLSHISQQPVAGVYAALVFSSNARDVLLTMAAGKEIMSKPE